MASTTYDHPWNPTEAEMAAYKRREVEMAIQNIKSMSTEGCLSSTLHSRNTIIAAAMIMKRTDIAELMGKREISTKVRK